MMLSPTPEQHIYTIVHTINSLLMTLNAALPGTIFAEPEKEAEELRERFKTTILHCQGLLMLMDQAFDRSQQPKSVCF